jgi:hypothetical protein
VSLLSARGAFALFKPLLLQFLHLGRSKSSSSRPSLLLLLLLLLLCSTALDASRPTRFPSNIGAKAIHIAEFRALHDVMCADSIISTDLCFIALLSSFECNLKYS